MLAGTSGPPRSPLVQPSRGGRVLAPLHRWVWRDVDRRARKLIHFAETEAEGGRHLAHAAELTADPLLRRLFLRHALDEERHAALFRGRGQKLWRQRAAGGQTEGVTGGFDADWLAPGERGLASESGLDRLRVGAMSDSALLAFLHLSERAAAERFALYGEMLEDDPETRAVFGNVLRDEVFHMTYTKTQLGRVAPVRGRRVLWRARAGRLWRAYLRLAGALAGLLGGVFLTVQYFLLLPWFAIAANRAARREPGGWHASAASAPGALESQY
ncbi:MAG TPA: ferritin-like domain-containing protein [Polyangia bacterium]